MKIILLAILIAIGSCSCFDRLKDSRNTLYAMSQQYSQDQNLDNYIDHFFDWAKTAPTTMEECGAQDLGAYFHNNFPDKCIDTLDVAVKKMIKLNGEKDNEIKYAIGIWRLIQIWHCSNDTTKLECRRNARPSKNSQLTRSTERESVLSHRTNCLCMSKSSLSMLPTTKDRRRSRIWMTS